MREACPRTGVMLEEKRNREETAESQKRRHERAETELKRSETGFANF